MRWVPVGAGVERGTSIKTAKMPKLLGLTPQEGHELLREYPGVRRERVARCGGSSTRSRLTGRGFDQIRG